MKKMPTLYQRDFSGTCKIVSEKPIEGLEGVPQGLYVPTEKKDGSCCCIINSELYKRYDAKVGKTGKQKPVPEGAILCQEEPDPITGHWPCWVKCIRNNPEDKYFFEGLDNLDKNISDGTYELIGPKVASNPYNLDKHVLYKHGSEILNLTKFSFQDIKNFLEENYIEGIVFWSKNPDGSLDQPVCKIKRSDFGFSWKNKKDRN